ncbi:hypothetical protein BJX65DRAFT_258482 [Aspergillus insuetus]
MRSANKPYFIVLACDCRCTLHSIWCGIGYKDNVTRCNRRGVSRDPSTIVDLLISMAFRTSFHLKAYSSEGNLYSAHSGCWYTHKKEPTIHLDGDELHSPVLPSCHLVDRKKQSRVNEKPDHYNSQYRKASLLCQGLIVSRNGIKGIIAWHSLDHGVPEEPMTSLFRH